MRRFISMLGAITLGTTAIAGCAKAAEPAAIWQSTCARCHGDDAAGYVARELRIVDGKLVVPATSMLVTTFLESGHGRLPSSAVARMAAYLTSLSQPR